MGSKGSYVEFSITKVFKFVSLLPFLSLNYLR